MIRKFISDDLDAVMRIWLDSNIKVHSFIPQDYWLNNSDMVKKSLHSAEVYVFRNENEIIGFIGLNDSYIEGIFVKESERSRGVGSQLLNYAKQIKSSLILHVYEKNNRALNFYKREGFKVNRVQIDTDTNQTEFEMIWSRI